MRECNENWCWLLKGYTEKICKMEKRMYVFFDQVTYVQYVVYLRWIVFALRNKNKNTCHFYKFSSINERETEYTFNERGNKKCRWNYIWCGIFFFLQLIIWKKCQSNENKNDHKELNSNIELQKMYVVFFIHSGFSFKRFFLSFHSTSYSVSFLFLFDFLPIFRD